MNDIRLLEKNTIDQIAAGEVVDRPASIVKELVENAIDAGSRAVSVEIRDGGISLIRITDNGCGIPKEQVALAFLRHSTSKIRDAKDLSFIHTLGFRGEALSSIAAVSKMQLCTKTADELTGTIYRISGGIEESLQGAGLPNGTTLIVRNLFFNTPARLKFLKSAQTEAGYITDVMNRICLSHPEISFKYTVNGSVRLSTPGNGSLKDVIYSIFGRDITQSLLEVDEKDEFLTLTGYLGKPEIARGNRSFEFFFVNGRFIRDKIIQKAVEEAYAGYQMKGTFPFAVIGLQMEPELVDVNVHPSKMEVRFFNNETVFHSIYELLRRRITQRESIPLVSIGNEKKEASSEQKEPKPYVPEPFERRRQATEVQASEPQASVSSSGVKTAPTSVSGFTASEKPGLWSQTGNEQPLRKPSGSGVHEAADSVTSSDGGRDMRSSSAGIYEEVMTRQLEKEAAAASVAEETPYGEQTVLPFIDRASRPKHKILGCVFDTYWIVELGEYMYLIDQHAAHEKVLYERFIKKMEQGEHYSQRIMPSVILTLTVPEETVLKEHAPAFQKAGFEVEHFGGSEYALSAVPADLYTVDPKLLFLEMLDDLQDISLGKGPEIMNDRIATAACKAAVKGGNKLSVQEAEALIDELLTLDNPYNCPHGRPTIIKMSRYELEKKFKRIV